MIADKRWTQSDITELRSRLEAGGSIADIAATLGRPAETVRLMAVRLCLRVRS